MIVRHESWLSLVLTVRQGTMLRVIWLRLTLATLLAALVTWAYHSGSIPQLKMTTAPFAIIGVALSIFLGFRNNAAYDRFWEGRKLWGALVNTSRTIARQALTLVDDKAIPAEERSAVEAWQKDLVYRAMAFVHALRISLRREDNFVSELEPFLDDSERELLRFEMNKPTAIAYAMGEKVSAARNKGWLHPMHQFQIEEQLTALTDIQGGCERILNTPIPLSHTALAHRIVAAYVVGLPFGLVDTVGLLTPVVVLLVAFAFYGLDAIGEEMEDPFGYDCNDLPLSSLSRMIENNLRQRLGEADLPPEVAPNASGVLQ